MVEVVVPDDGSFPDWEVEVVVEVVEVVEVVVEVVEVVEVVPARPPTQSMVGLSAPTSASLTQQKLGLQVCSAFWHGASSVHTSF